MSVRFPPKADIGAEPSISQSEALRLQCRKSPATRSKWNKQRTMAEVWPFSQFVEIRAEGMASINFINLASRDSPRFRGRVAQFASASAISLRLLATP